MASTILVVRSVESLQSFRACQDRIADAIKACSQGGCHFIDGHPTHLQTVADCTGSRDVEVCSLRILRRLAVAEELGKVGPSCLQPHPTSQQRIGGNNPSLSSRHQCHPRIEEAANGCHESEDSELCTAAGAIRSHVNEHV
jgi:hypothetical protein